MCFLFPRVEKGRGRGRGKRRRKRESGKQKTLSFRVSEKEQNKKTGVAVKFYSWLNPISNKIFIFYGNIINLF